jgi:dnd system-associated protein 4
MTVANVDIRVRRPQEHEALLNELRDEGAFPTFRDALLFAAALGCRFERKVSFTTAAGDPIRYETLTSPTFAEALINMIAATASEGDPEIMDNSRLEERISLFEAYANGGLEYIQEQVNTRRQPALLVVQALVTEALAKGGGAEPLSVDELLSGVNWK